MRIGYTEWDCSGNGLCHAVDGELFALDDDGFVVIGAEVAPERVDVARRGVAACPVQALRIED